CFFFSYPPPTHEFSTLSLHDALPIFSVVAGVKHVELSANLQHARMARREFPCVGVENGTEAIPGRARVRNRRQHGAMAALVGAVIAGVEEPPALPSDEQAGVGRRQGILF